jgi:hypothetical protein
MPLFFGPCEHCGVPIRYVHDRPFQHDPATCQHNIEAREVTPWKL